MKYKCPKWQGAMSGVCIDRLLNTNVHKALVYHPVCLPIRLETL